jgi:hypothetical protein
MTGGLRVVRELAQRFLFQTIHDLELMLYRERQGREQGPTAAVIDNQSVKAPSTESAGSIRPRRSLGASGTSRSPPMGDY